MRDRGKNIREKETETLDGQSRFLGVREWWNVTQKDEKKGDQRRGSEKGV